jgi:hypothetical protein
MATAFTSSTHNEMGELSNFKCHCGLTLHLEYGHALFGCLFPRTDIYTPIFMMFFLSHIKFPLPAPSGWSPGMILLSSRKSTVRFRISSLTQCCADYHILVAVVKLDHVVAGIYMCVHSPTLEHTKRNRLTRASVGRQF